MALAVIWRVMGADGVLPATLDTADEAAAVVRGNPGAAASFEVRVLNPCPSHPRQEADACLPCGTAYDMGAKWRP